MAKVKRKLAREKAVITVYQYLLVKSTLSEMKTFLNNDEDLIDDDSAKEYATHLIELVYENAEQYIEEISKHIKKGWSWTRLGYMEKAILLIASAEMLDCDLDKKIVINEAVSYAKIYCDEEAYKLINGILGSLI